MVPAGNTRGVVDIDELFNALDANTREGLRRLIRGFGAWYQGKSAQANLTSRYFPPALRAYSNLFSQIDESTPSLDQFLTQTSKALGAIDARAPELTDLITQSRITAQAISSQNRALSQTLVNHRFPPIRCYTPSASTRGTPLLRSSRRRPRCLPITQERFHPYTTYAAHRR